METNTYILSKDEEKTIQKFKKNTKHYFRNITSQSGLEYNLDNIYDSIKEEILYRLDDIFSQEPEKPIFHDVLISGSRSRGNEDSNSDLDIIFIYTASNTKEYHMFNLLHEDPIYIGNVEVDINPINTKETNIIDYLEDVTNYLDRESGSVER